MLLGMPVIAGSPASRYLRFGHSSCGWCDKINGEAFSDQQLHKLYNNHSVLVPCGTSRWWRRFENAVSQ